jgi:hypothetical protein
MTTQTIAERLDLLRSEKQQIDSAIEITTQEKCAIDVKLNTLVTQKKECKQKMMDLHCEEFYEKHGVRPEEVILDFKKVVDGLTFISYDCSVGLPNTTVAYGFMEACGSTELIGLSLYRIFGSYNDWQKCKMTPLEVEAAKALKVYQEIDFSVNPWTVSKHKNWIYQNMGTLSSKRQTEFESLHQVLKRDRAFLCE